MRVVVMMSSIAMGGGERNIVSALPYIHAAGAEVSLCTLNTRRDSPLTDDFNASGIQRFDLGAKRMIDLAAWGRFRAMLRDERIDLVHSQDQDTHVYAATALRLLGKPVVMTRHVMIEPMDTFKESIRARMVLGAARFGADRVLAVSEAVRQRFAEQAHIPLERIETIYNGIHVEHFATRNRRIAKRAELGWGADDPVIVMVAVLRRGKGHEVLFEAIPQIKAAIPNAKIKLVGDGELAESLRQQAAPYGDTVEFMGQRMDVPELLGASDILVLPSWSEALPTVLIEAGAASLPCVATDVGGAGEIVQDGDTGYLVQPGDSAQLAAHLITLLQNQAQARAMGERARQRVLDTFSLTRQAEQTVALYERILRERTHA